MATRISAAEARKLGIPTKGRIHGPRKPRKAAKAPGLTLDKIAVPGGSQTFFVPGAIPPTDNQLLSRHYTRRSKIKRSWYDLVAHYAREAGITVAEGRRRVVMTVVMLPGKRRPDPANLRKCLNDSLVKCGALVDDSAVWIEETDIQWERSLDFGTRITLEDVE